MKQQPTILDLLGGVAFLTRTGSERVVENERSLSLDVSKARDQIRRVVIERGDYRNIHLVAYRVDRKTAAFVEVARFECVAPSALPAVFTRLTGLFTRP